ncbi:aminoglycoside phosphotransferase [Streptomyces sp. RKND-216]|uniref:aminoglycoside phosphotransferase family protein n=1 Tax=Streptomyces sp. RKND-216 TaxID=2562581 RepID=UPI00109D8D60|nr:aminoglycoside phosphotransferase family protein [Streptomyces sp. RKND-216]THA23893.1 aminoglycoside phosphotransferase [Streptomyces sp. RKND-216]
MRSRDSGSDTANGPAHTPGAVRDRLVVRFGPEVLAWCDALPALAGELAARWDLQLLASRGGGTSRVLRCRRRGAGTTVWLKVTPAPAIAREEAEALHRWAGSPSVVGLLAQDLQAGALLLEDVAPGPPVQRLAGRLPEVAALLRALREPSPGREGPSALRPLSERVDFLCRLTERRADAAGVPGRFGSAFLERARTRCRELSDSAPVGLVHGDLHPANVLSGPGGRLVAIDPRPAWGDPDFDAVDWVLDGVSDLAALKRRTAELAAMVPGLCPDRVLGWCRVQAPLAAVPRVCAGRDDEQTRFLLALAGR